MKIRNTPRWAALCCLVLFATGSVSAEDALSITSPVERQVTQRTEEDRADITIAGVVQGRVDVIEANLKMEKK